MSAKKLVEVQDLSIPVITLDGPAAVGKGPTRRILATELGYRELDSGAIYRAVALQAQKRDILEDIHTVAKIIPDLIVQIDGEEVFVNGKRVTSLIRSNYIGKLTANIAKFKEIRDGVRGIQLAARVSPGLVADGRDMAYIFETEYRFWLDASLDVRAKRRFDQLKKMGKSELDFEDVRESTRRRDNADINRTFCPLVRHPKAWIIDTGITKDANETAGAILSHCHRLKQSLAA